MICWVLGGERRAGASLVSSRGACWLEAVRDEVPPLPSRRRHVWNARTIRGLRWRGSVTPFRRTLFARGFVCSGKTVCVWGGEGGCASSHRWFMPHTLPLPIALPGVSVGGLAHILALSRGMRFRAGICSRFYSYRGHPLRCSRYVHTYVWCCDASRLVCSSVRKETLRKRSCDDLCLS